MPEPNEDLKKSPNSSSSSGSNSSSSTMKEDCQDSLAITSEVESIDKPNSDCCKTISSGNNLQIVQKRPNDKHDDDDDNELPGPEVGRLSFGQKLNRVFFSIYSYIFFYTLFGLLSLTYHSMFNSSLSTLEKRYHFSSSTGGLVMITDNIATVLTNLFIGYYGKTAHKPRWMSIGCLISGLSVMLTALPYFIYGSVDEQDLAMSTLSNPLMADANHMTNSNGPNNVPGQTSATFLQDLSPPMTNSVLNSHTANFTAQSFAQVQKELCTSLNIDEDCSQDKALKTMTMVALICFAASNFFRGFGTSIYFTYGTPYLDDNVSKTEMPTIFGFIFAARLFGVPMGFFISSVALKLYENPFYKPLNMVPTDPRWIGAWWMGFLISGSLMTLIAIPLAFFPREFKKSHKREVDVESSTAIVATKEKTGVSQASTEISDNTKDSQLSKNLLLAATNETSNKQQQVEVKEDLSLKNLPKEILEIACNPIIACQMLGNLFRGIGVIGYYVFQTRYIEAQFKQTASKASLTVGTTGFLAKIFGVSMGGLLISMFRPKARTLTTIIFLVELTSVFALLWASTIVGPQHTYTGTEFDQSTGLMRMTSTCNADCHCRAKSYSPVCDPTSDRAFISPCHAGCRHFYQDSQEKIITYTECSCVENELKSVSKCTSSEDKMMFYVNIVALGAMISGSSRSGNMVTFFRSIRPEQKSLAVAMGSFWHSLCVSIPYPIIFSYIFDSSCQYWSYECNKRGNCWSHDSTKLRYFYHSVAIVLVALGSVFDLIMIMLSPRLGNLYEDDDGSPTVMSKINKFFSRLKFWSKTNNNDNDASDTKDKRNDETQIAMIQITTKSNDSEKKEVNS